MKKKSVLNVLTFIVGVMLVFGFTGCDELLNQITGGNTDINLSGSVSISPSGTVAVGTQLTANYTGSESVSYQWNRGTINAGTGQTITASEAGSYTVTVSATGYNSKTSSPVIVSSTITALSGNITISPPGPVAVSTPLTASYSGSETVSYQWSRNVTTNVGTNSTTYTPDQAGSYTVTVSAEGYVSKTSLPVVVTDLLDNTGTQTNPIVFTDTNGSYPGALTTARQAVWYSFTANGRYDLTVRDYQYRPTNAATSPYTADVRVSVLDATLGYMNDINNRQMNAVDIGADNQSPVIFTDLTGVYFVKIEPYSAGGTGTFYVALANAGPVTTGAGQADAIDITSYSPVPFELELTSSRPTRWFKFTADGRYDLTVGDYQYRPGTSTTSPYTVDARVSVLDANLGYVADINNRQMNAVDIGANNQSPVILTDLSGVYYVKIDRYSEYSSFGSFLVTLEKTGLVTAGAGQADAIELTIGAARVRNELTSSRPSRWFKFTAPAGGSVSLTVYDYQYQPSGLTEEKPNVDARVTVLDASLQFVSSSGGTAMNGIDIGANNQSPVTFNSLTPGSVYYVKIDRYSEYSNYGFFYIGIN